jgi:multidrug resistance efflux pump
VDGSITAAPVKEGATVKKGQLLLSLDGALLQQEVAMATADLALANDRLKGSQAQLRELERNAYRLSTGASEGVSSNQQADAAKQQLAGDAPMSTWPVRRSTWPSTSWNTPG